MRHTAKKIWEIQKKSRDLSHSAKGSTWDKHKYIKRENGLYYYPDSYKGGRHLPDGEKASSSGSESKFKEYDKNDPDFADEVYEKATPIGDSEFLSYQKEDGSWIILEEDMKWELPKGVDPTKGDFKKNLEKFGNIMTALREDGQGEAVRDNWEKWATEAIDYSVGGRSYDKLLDERVEEIKKREKGTKKNK